MPVDDLENLDLGDDDSAAAQGADAASGSAAGGSGAAAGATGGSPPPPPASPPPAAPSVREMLAARGYETGGFQDDQAALDGLLATAEAFHQAQPYLHLGHRYAGQADRIDAWLAEQQKAAAAPSAEPAKALPPTSPAQPAAFEWKSPEYDPAWESRVRLDQETGRYAPATQYDSPLIAEKLNAFRDWQAQKAREIVQRFPELVEQSMAGRLAAIEKLIEERAEKIVAAKLGEYETRSTTQTYFSQRDRELFEFDAATGRKKLDPMTGQEVLTPKGKAFVEHAQQGRNFGISDSQKLIAYVEAQIARDEQAGRFGAGGPNGSGAKTAQEKKGEFLEKALRGAHASQRSGTFPAPTAPDDSLQNPDASLDEIFNDVMREQGHLPQTG